MVEKRKGASLSPKNFITGGLLDDVDVTFKNVKFEMFDYNGTQEPTPALGIDLVTGSEEPGEKPYRNHWSVGKAEMWAPSDDGMEIVPIGKDLFPRKTSNLYFLVTTLLEAKVPDEVLDSGRVDVLEGLKVHIVRKEPPGKKSDVPKEKRVGRDGKEYEKDGKIYAVSKIYEPFPWVAGAAAGDMKKAAGGASTEDLEATAKGILMQLVMAGNGKTSKKDIPTKGFALIDKKDPNKNDIFGFLFKDAWIKANGFVIAADGTITLAE